MFNISLEQIWWIFIEQTRGIYYSDVLLVLLIAAFVAIVPGYILHIKHGLSVKRIILIFLTLFYGGIILLLTVFRREAGSKSMEIYTYLNLGMTRRGIYSRSQVIYSMMNLVLFVPWGIIMGLYRENQNPVRIIIMSTLIGFITSFTIELTQLITGTGRFEVTDLFTNVAGCFIGAIFVSVYVIIRGWKKNDKIRKK